MASKMQSFLSFFGINQVAQEVQNQQQDQVEVVEVVDETVTVPPGQLATFEADNVDVVANQNLSKVNVTRRVNPGPRPTNVVQMGGEEIQEGTLHQ